MKIDLSQIPAEGLFCSEEFDVKKFDFELRDIKFEGPLKISLEAQKYLDAVCVKTKVDYAISMLCSRCLEKFLVTKSDNLSFNYSLKDNSTIVDITDDIRQEIILNYPIKPICKSNCQGLCPQCGRNLNEGKCDCK